MPVPLKPGTWIKKDPDADLPYEFDWGKEWLGASSTITDSDWTVTPVTSSPLVVAAESIAAGNRSTIVRLTGGRDGDDYQVTNRITTNDVPAKIDDRTLIVRCRHR